MSPDRPPRPVTLGNWQDPDLLRWSYRHVDEILPTAAIAHGERASVPLPSAPVDLGALDVSLPDGTSRTVSDVLTGAGTDAWLALHDHRVAGEAYAPGMTPGSRHLLQSVSKSVVSSVAGALVGAGRLDVDAPVTGYVPELAGSGYAGATVRQILDMRSGIAFVEDYLGPGSDSRRLEAAGGWAPRTGGSPATIKDYLRGLRRARPHGGPFEYRSGETDVLGWVCEAAGGARFATLAGDLVWSRLGAEFDAFVTLDAEGTAMFDGGICAALRDLGRFGAMVVDGGVSLRGERVLPQWWVDDVFAGGEDSAEAFAASPDDTSTMPGGHYRSQFWSPTASGDVALAVGIHGQLIYLNRASRTVGVLLSSWPTPQDPARFAATLEVFRRIDAHLSGGPAG